MGCVNLSDMSLEDGPSIVTKAFPCISLVVRAISMSSKLQDDSVVVGDCQDCSKRSTGKGVIPQSPSGLSSHGRVERIFI